MSGQTVRSVRRYRPRDVDYARPHHVYRAFDSYGHLLYVGCSLTVGNRLASHRSQSPWFRFAETLAIAGPWDRKEALAREREAIETEGPYFNWSHADMVRTAANRKAAERSVAAHGHPRPSFDLDREGDGAYHAEHAEAFDCWYRAVEREVARLKATTHPFFTDADRLATYRAAREDAELARLEAAA